MPTPTQIYIDESGKVHVSYPCDSCSEWVHTDDHCGYGEDYLCPDCFVPATSPEDKEHAMALDPHAVRGVVTTTPAADALCEKYAAANRARLDWEDDCDECGGMGHTIGFEGPKKIKYPCETCGGAS